jgi:hypothetical protein
MLKRTVLGVIAATVGIAVALTSGQAFAHDDRLMKVLKRGELVVGVKADFKPWGFRDSSGRLVGMEIDMANDVAKALGVKLKLVPVQSSNRMQLLQQGKIDLMIATMSDRTDRRKLVGIVEPNYYTSGTNLLAKKGVLKEWWALAVPLEELNGIWGNFMAGMVYNWHSSGRLIELEKKWGIQSTQFVIDMNKKLEDQRLPMVSSRPNPEIGNESRRLQGPLRPVSRTSARCNWALPHLTAFSC